MVGARPSKRFGGSTTITTTFRAVSNDGASEKIIRRRFGGKRTQKQRRRMEERRGAGTMRANKAPASSASSSRSSVSSSDASREELLEEMEKLKKENATLKMLEKQLDDAIKTSREEDEDEGDDETVEVVKTQTTVPKKKAKGNKKGSTPGTLRTDPKSESEIEWPLPITAEGCPVGEEGKKPFWEMRPKNDPDQLFLDDGKTKKTNEPIKISHVTAELAPLAKVGGLGDVTQGLGRAMKMQGHDVQVILPFYQSLDANEIFNLKHVMDFDVPKGMKWDGEDIVSMMKTSAYSGNIGGCDVILLKPHEEMNSNIFKGGAIYGGSYNELEAYLYFSRASLEYLDKSGRDPDVIHVHEWQTCAVPMLYWEEFSHGKTSLNKAKIVMTIHNLDNTGECREEEFFATGVNGKKFNVVEKALDERTIGHNPERMCLMKGGVVYANKVTTVSPTYAKETLDGNGGFMSQILRANQEKFSGVLNGIDYQLWNPALDATLPANFAPGNKMIENKRLCKKYLQIGLGLDVDETKPLIACISRLVPQKGIHLIERAVTQSETNGNQFVLLGSGHSDGGFKRMANEEFSQANSTNVRLMITYSDTLSRLMYAAADFVLVPSMFEPCGLTQMIAMRYGALPIVRSTGGLADTVIDCDADAKNGNGFVFYGVDDQSLDECIQRAIKTFQDRKTFCELQERVARVDYGWEASGNVYAQLYESL